LWFHRDRDPTGTDYLAARLECDRLGASAEAARFRVQLVLGNLDLMALADAAFAAVGAINGSSDVTELRERENHFEAAVTAFIHAAANRLRTVVPSSGPGKTDQGIPATSGSLQ